MCRRCLFLVILAVCPLVLWQTLIVEAFHIPTGSMAPALHGQHRVCACPRCGHNVVVGRAGDDRTGNGEPRFYRNAFCPNCGLFPIPVTGQAEAPGDQIVVNKSAYLVRTPARWEIVVFRLLGTFYIKRLLGLPGEEISIRNGDIYVNGKLLRKDFSQARAMRVLVFDQEKAPPGGWRERWVGSTANGEPALDGRTKPATLTYRHYLLDSAKCEPIRDEYAYNGGLRADSECVHDFLAETEIEASGRGTLTLRLSDGHDWVEVLLPVETNRVAEMFTWPSGAPEKTRKLAETNSPVNLRAGQRYRLEVALVDRRFSAALDGRVVLSADLPEAKHRSGVERPFQARADGVRVSLRHFRLYRDVHYGQQGTNAVGGKAVRLGAQQYFMLGDNSPNSEDSRFWPDDGRVRRADLVGPMMRVQKRE